MDALIGRLREKLQKWSDNDDLQQALSACSALKDGVGGVGIEHVERGLARLHSEGLWDAGDQAIFEHLKKTLSREQSSKANSVTNPGQATSPRTTSERLHDVPPIQVHAGQTVPRVPFSFDTPTALPMELYGALNQAYYLHTLAIEPETLLPPGKSLLSVLSNAHTDGRTNSALHDRVEHLVHRAFWDEALESLSNPSPPVQLSRLKRLYEDLHVALSPLLPSEHPVLFALSSPLSPTSSPLRSAIIHLREVLESLKKRCAPARDPQIDALLRRIEDPPDISLPQAVVDVVRSLVKLADGMKDDLSQFVLGSMSERQLRDVIIKRAAGSEREIVGQLWKDGLLENTWKQWLEEGEAVGGQSPGRSIHQKFVSRLMRAIGTIHSVSCNLPTVSVNISPSGTLQLDRTPSETPSTSPNPLPPPLLFVTPALFHVQNYLQALVIAASLRALVRIPVTPAKRKAGAEEDNDVPEDDFLKRIWSLLKADIDGAETGLKLVNLADEVVRISQRFGGTLDGAQREGKESQLREAVDRTLKPTDPVFLLLQTRLVEAATAHLLAHPPVVATEKVPKEMNTGRRPKKASQRPNLFLNKEDANSEYIHLDFVREMLSVKGFDHPVLVEAVSDMLLMVRRCIAWTELSWPEMFEIDST